MRAINYLVCHCTGASQKQSVASILSYWRNENGWKMPGYHFIIKPDGSFVKLLPIDQVSNGVKGHNHDSIHFCYIGGENGKDERTDAQKQTMYELLKEHKEMFPKAKILGHRDFKGVTKSCPNFNVADWLKCVGLSNK